MNNTNVMNIIEDYIDHLECSFIHADNYYSKLDPTVITMQGMTGLKTRHFYNNVCSLKDCRYLEIGSWLGSSVCAAMWKNEAIVVCIDNFSQFNEGGDIKKEFLKNTNACVGRNSFSFIEDDCFKVNLEPNTRFNIYMYDGEHSYQSQYVALSYFYKNMDDLFIYIVDDWNNEEVRRGTFDAIRDLNLRVWWSNSKMTEANGVQLTWWNGMYVAILEKGPSVSKTS